MDIDLTDLASDEIIVVLEAHPQGHLEIKFDRVYWITRIQSRPRASNLPQPITGGANNQPRRKGNQIFDFQAAADSLGSMVC